jgi:hypothetical protein
MDSLETALQRLSSPENEQLALQPYGSCRPDEIALECDDHWKFWKPRIWSDLTVEQRDALEDVDVMLNTMSKVGGEAVWSDRGVMAHPYWVELRRLASVALQELRKKSLQPAPTAVMPLAAQEIAPAVAVAKH